MKKIIILVIILLIGSCYPTIVLGNEAADTVTVTLDFFEPVLKNENNFLKLTVEGANTYIFNEGKPMLPVYTNTYVLPFGIKVTNIGCTTYGAVTKELTNTIVPVPQRVITSEVDLSATSVLDEAIYTSAEVFPDNWYSYHVGVGLDTNMEHKTFVTLQVYPVRYQPTLNIIEYISDIELIISFETPTNTPFPVNSEYDLVIVAPSVFENDLQPLIDHKTTYGVTTMFKTTEEIYSDYTGVDKPEQIKYFIKDAIETWNAKYILLVGGLNSVIWAKARDDDNQGTKHWRVPVRYTNLEMGEPGYVSDLYYADIYKEGGEFDDWDSDNDGKFAERIDKLDLYPDVALGRLACRSTREVQTVVDKIIHYESQTYGEDWFNKMIVVSGDGFLDQDDLNIEWDTTELPNGAYTIYAQSTNPDGVSGPIDEIQITIDKSTATSLTFNHDDHLKTSSYPFEPIAEIMTVSNGDVLGNTNFNYRPSEGEAYCNQFTGYANMEYRNEILHIRGKTYDPRPYGELTDIHVWITNSNGDIIFDQTVNDSKMYFEGEWSTGERLLHERGGGLYYMPETFEKEILWTSNGKFTGQDDVIAAFSEGSGFIFFSGHGSPLGWSNHNPGVPGNRREASVGGLRVIDLGYPFLPMETISNDNKLPVLVVGGCHNSMFTVSLLTTFFDRDNSDYMHSYGIPVPECWSWYLTSLPKRGAIASIGNTGYGLGVLGEWCTTGGVDNWITSEFFVQYGTNGHTVLGDTHSQTITSYINTFGRSDDGDIQAVQQWVLLGDPSLNIGGYPSTS